MLALNKAPAIQLTFKSKSMKNKQLVDPCRGVSLIKIWRIMKISVLLIIIGIMNTFAKGYSQDVQISVNIKNGSVTDLFRAIEQKSEYRIFYKTNLISDAKKVTLNETNKSVSAILTEVLSERDLSFDLIDKVIVITPSSVAQQQKLSGTVVDAVTNEPLIGVTINIQGTSKRAVTDVYGKYSIDGSTPDAVIVFSYIGYLTQKIPVNGQSNIDVKLAADIQSLGEVVVVGFGVQKKESITGAISGVTMKDLDRVHGSTVSATLAGKIAGVTFRMSDGRPGSSANIQIRNMGNPLYVIDGIQQDGGQFNNISPNDIESITVLKDASAAIYGVRAANGVIVVTTKRGTKGSRNVVNVDAYTGWQNWSRFPSVVNDSYTWMLGKAEGQMNQDGRTAITQAELAKFKEGTAPGYQNFNWKDYIIKANAPLSSVNVSASGGSDKINYYLSATNLSQQSVLGREFTFKRQNLQSNVDAQISDRLKVGIQINGRIETRDNPGIPGGDDYWLPRFAILRNRPFERPYANDNPEYLNDIGHNETNWAYNNKKLGGYSTSDWRVLQSNITAEYIIPGIKGLVAKGMYSYYIADQVMNGHEYTYTAFTYQPTDSTYKATGGSTNPWRERFQEKVIRNVYQAQLNYNNTFGKHTIGATVAAERQEAFFTSNWVHAVPLTNALPLIYFSTADSYNDGARQEARIGYIGRLNYNYSDKYYVEVAGRRDASWKFAPDKRVGYFPSASAGWRITQEPFMKSLLGASKVISDLKVRGSYGILGDDDIGIGPYDYLPGYNYNQGIIILGGVPVVGSQDKGNPITTISWFKSKILDLGIDFSLFSNKLTGAVDYFNRNRTGLRGRKYDIVIPSELGYVLPDENVNSDSQKGIEGSLAYTGKIGELNYNIAGNASFSRARFEHSYKPRFNNSWDQYRGSGEERYRDITWGFETIGQFQSMEQINNYPVNIDDKGNSTLLPGDLIYKDVNGDGKISGLDERPIGYIRQGQPNLTYGFNLRLNYKSFDFTADFSGGSMYTFIQNWELRNPFQNEGALNELLTDRWHRADPFDLNSEWIPGRFPAYRFNNGGHSNYNKTSTFWTTNIHYLRARTIEIGFSLPKSILAKLKIQKARIYINGYNLFSLDNVAELGIDPEIADENGLTYPQNKFVNVGVNLSL